MKEIESFEEQSSISYWNLKMKMVKISSLLLKLSRSNYKFYIILELLLFFL